VRCSILSTLIGERYFIFFLPIFGEVFSSCFLSLFTLVILSALSLMTLMNLEHGWCFIIPQVGPLACLGCNVFVSKVDIESLKAV